MAPDKRAVRILADTYWSAAGWKRDPTTSPEDFAYAKAHGLMFDPVSISHDEAVNGVLAAVAATDKDKVVAAFLASLGSRRLDIRSALGTYAVGRHMRVHSKHHSGPCAYCGKYDLAAEDLNILNFERFKWGGVRHTHPEYIAFDLRVFSAVEEVAPREEDLVIFRSIVDAAASMPAKARPNHLDKALAKIVPSNGAERRVLIEILGYAGILVDPGKPDFRQGFVPVDQRARTPWHTDDWSYPAQWWMGSYGVNQSAVDEWFPAL